MQFPHVFLEVEVPAEALAADLAGEGFFVVVGVHVEGEVVDLVEGFRADGAFISFFPAVGELVIFVIALLMEAFAAVFADEGLISGVDPGVSIQRR